MELVHLMMLRFELNTPEIVIPEVEEEDLMGAAEVSAEEGAEASEAMMITQVIIISGLITIFEGLSRTVNHSLRGCIQMLRQKRQNFVSGWQGSQDLY